MEESQASMDYAIETLEIQYDFLEEYKYVPEKYNVEN